MLDSVNNRLMIFRANTGEKLTEFDLKITQMGPPISFVIDGKQYISVTGAPGAGGGGRGAPAANAPRPPAKLWVFSLDGKMPLPGTTAN